MENQNQNQNQFGRRSFLQGPKKWFQRKIDRIEKFTRKILRITGIAAILILICMAAFAKTQSFCWTTDKEMIERIENLNNIEEEFGNSGLREVDECIEEMFNSTENCDQ